MYHSAETLEEISSLDFFCIYSIHRLRHKVYIYIFTCVYTNIHWVNSDKPLKWPRLPFTIPSNKRIHFHPKKSGMFSMDYSYIWKWFKEEKAPSTCIHCLLICLSSPQIKYPCGPGIALVLGLHLWRRLTLPLPSWEVLALLTNAIFLRGPDLLTVVANSAWTISAEER